MHFITKEQSFFIYAQICCHLLFETVDNPQDAVMCYKVPF
jgi:hypothetical protein